MVNEAYILLDELLKKNGKSRGDLGEILHVGKRGAQLAVKNKSLRLDQFEMIQEYFNENILVPANQCYAERVISTELVIKLSSQQQKEILENIFSNTDIISKLTETK